MASVTRNSDLCLSIYLHCYYWRHLHSCSVIDATVYIIDNPPPPYISYWTSFLVSILLTALISSSMCYRFCQNIVYATYPSMSLKPLSPLNWHSNFNCAIPFQFLHWYTHPLLSPSLICLNCLCPISTSATIIVSVPPLWSLSMFYTKPISPFPHSYTIVSIPAPPSPYSLFSHCFYHHFPFDATVASVPRAKSCMCSTLTLYPLPCTYTAVSITFPSPLCSCLFHRFHHHNIWNILIPIPIIFPPFPHTYVYVFIVSLPLMFPLYLQFPIVVVVALRNRCSHWHSWISTTTISTPVLHPPYLYSPFHLCRHFHSL